MYYSLKNWKRKKKCSSSIREWKNGARSHPCSLDCRWKNGRTRVGREEEWTIPRLSMPVSPWVYPWRASLRRPRTLICSPRCDRFKAYWTAIYRRQRDQESLLTTHLSVIKRPTLISFPLPNSERDSERFLRRRLIKLLECEGHPSSKVRWKFRVMDYSRVWLILIFSPILEFPHSNT